MKQQSSLNLKINDNPVNSNALENSLMLRATNSGLKLFNSVGEELPICSSVFKVQEFPTSGMIENSIYILESGEAKAYFAEGWIDISQEVVETIDDSASNDNIPTTKAVKDYIDANAGSGGISTITVGAGLTGNGTQATPLTLDLSNYTLSEGESVYINTQEAITIISNTNIQIGNNSHNLIITNNGIEYNGHIQNTANGLVVLGNDGKIPVNLYDAGGQSVFQVESFPTSGENNSLYIDKNTSEVKGYFNGTWQDVSYECVDTIDDTATVETIPSTKAVKDYVDSLSTGPAMKNEATAENIVFKKDISIYKIELTTATTFTFDWSQLDSEICYTFELWVSMSTPVTLTFPSDVAWLNDEVPDMSEASTYCIVVRKLPSTMGTSTITSPKALLNLAYQYSLVLG